MGKDSEYYQKKELEQNRNLERLLSNLPPLCKEVIEFKSQTCATSSLVSYCYDLGIFFRYYLSLEDTKVHSMQEITYKTIECIPAQKFYDFQKYLEFNDVGEYHKSTKKGIARRMAAVRNMYKYHYKMGNIKFNPTEMVMLPKLVKDKTIITLNKKEINMLLNALSNQKCFKRGRMKTYKKMTKQRDMAVVVLLLNTGIRIGECVGLDLSDIDLTSRTPNLIVIRKGGAMDRVYFNKSVADVLKKYIKGERKEILNNKGLKDSPDKNALFLSIYGKRLKADSIEKMLREYTSRLFPDKRITPHKLRSTYGTALYKETGDIRLVADVLGHDNINTTIKYYAKADDEKKIKAAKAVVFTKKTMVAGDNEDVDDTIDNNITITTSDIEKSLDKNKRKEEKKSNAKEAKIVQFKKKM